MAQFLGHEEQKPDELNQFYNIEGNQTVQYVIADDHHHQFPSQQIVVVDGSQSQSVILDQSQITYQALPQYTIEGGDQQQVFFMEGTSNQPIQQVIQTIAPQTVQTVVQAQPIQQQSPVVLNPNIVNVNKTVGQVVQPPIARQRPEIRPTVRLPMQQIRPAPPGQIKGTQRMQQPRHQMPGQQRPPLASQQQPRPRLAMNPQRPQMLEQQQGVALPDGTIVSVAAYKRMIEQKNKTTIQQQQQQQQQRIPSGVMPNNQMDNVQAGVVGGGNPTPAAKKRAPANRGNPGRGGRAPARGGRAGIPVNQQHQPNSMPGNFQPPQSQFEESPVPRQYQAQHQRNLMHQRNQPPQRPMLQQQQQRSQANYVIQPPNQHKPTQHRPLPSYIPSSQIQQIIENTPVSEEFSDSIRMLVLLDNGEQRLITFTLPKEACTIQEILEQVNVPFQQDTNIQVTEANTNGINYIVTVGEVPQFQYQEENEGEEGQQVQNNQQQAQQQKPPEVAPPPQPTMPETPPKEPSPEPVKVLLPKYVPGKLALCGNCGYLSEDFAKCTRCTRPLPDDVKAIPSKLPTNGRQTDIRSPLNEKKLNALKNGTDIKPSPTSAPKKKGKPKAVEHETVCLVSSDEEDDPKTPVKSVNEELLAKLDASISFGPVQTKEPSLTDIQKHVMNKFHGMNQEVLNPISMNLLCRTVRIGSYRFIPTEKILIESTGITLKVPHPHKETEIKTVRIDQSDIVRVLVNFNKALPLLFYYLTPTVGANVRELLGMEKGAEPYFNPLSEKEESHKRITLLPDEFMEEDKNILQEIYAGPPHNILDELLAKEANDILVKTCPKDPAKSGLIGGGLTEIKPLLQYPPEGRGRLTINTEDYICLATDQFLNDVIIDFYLKYLINNLPKEKQEKVHVFSTFFYKRLTTKPQKASRKCQPSELDNTLTAAQKRHARVKTWTKTVNLFEKDYVIVPINENAHWFLAIICFPGMDGPHTFDGEPYKLEPKTPKKKKNSKEKEKLPMLVCDDPELSDKDEAEGDESDMDSDDSDASTPSTQSTPTNAPSIPTASPVKGGKVERPPIKQPCILIFDSLAGNCRSRVVATLRDYLTCEYKAKMDKDRVFNKDVIKGSNIKVPQQNNFTDCGLYVLQYVEQFFKDPIVDYNLPTKQLKNWFDEIVVTRKREEISELIKNLMMEYDIDLGMLPNIKFPTLNGKLVERCSEENENEDMFEDSSFEDDDEPEPGEIVAPVANAPTLLNQDSSTTSSESPQSVIKPSENSMNETFDQCVISALKPDMSEFPRQTTNKDTLSYLKAKRIIRHKLGASEGPDPKKAKSE